MEEVFRSHRLIEVWRYTVSHRQLLLRSSKDNSYSTRLEVLFKDVAFIAVPPVMRGMMITKCGTTGDELATLLNFPQVSKPWYRIETDGFVGYVAAGSIVISEDDLGYEDPSSLLSGPLL